MKRYSQGDPEPTGAKQLMTISGQWYKSGRGWQHELADTDMGDLAWDELLEVFGAVYVWEKEQ